MEDYDSLSLGENHRLGIEHWNAERFFPAHEAWETCWKQAKFTPEAEFFKGLSQLGAGYVHLLRGNQHGAKTLLRRGAGRLQKYESGHRGIPTQALAAATRRQANQIERAEHAGKRSPKLAFPKI
jgi:predicted metal-dependent hydrolase